MTDETKLEKSRPLPDAIVRRGITAEQWNTLRYSLYPGAKPESILLVLDYCRTRKLDPLKKPCHIVPMRVHDQVNNEWKWRDVVMPGIYEYRTTAQRTGEYLGHSKPEFGPTIEFAGVKAPEWCSLTVYRHNQLSGQRVEFPVTVFFREVVATKKVKTGDTVTEVANDRWTRAPIQMLVKCTEAAGLREGFPDELGGEHTMEELEGKVIGDENTLVVVPQELQPKKPKGYTNWLDDLTAAAGNGRQALETAFEASDVELRTYLVSSDPERWNTLKETAATVDGEGAVEDGELPL